MSPLWSMVKKGWRVSHLPNFAEKLAKEVVTGTQCKNDLIAETRWNWDGRGNDGALRIELCNDKHRIVCNESEKWWIKLCCQLWQKGWGRAFLGLEIVSWANLGSYAARKESNSRAAMIMCRRRSQSYLLCFWESRACLEEGSWNDNVGVMWWQVWDVHGGKRTLFVGREDMWAVRIWEWQPTLCPVSITKHRSSSLLWWLSKTW